MTEQTLKPLLQKLQGREAFNYEQKIKKPTLRGLCLLLCCLIVCILVLLMILFGLLTVFFIDPKPPTFHLVSFTISHFDVNSNGEGSAYLNARATSHIDLSNPHSNVMCYYGESNVDVSVGSGHEMVTTIGTTSIAALKRGFENITTLKLEIDVKNQKIDDAVGSKLLEQYKSNSLVVNVEIKANVQLGFGNIRIGKLIVGVSWRGIALKEINGVAGGLMPQCSTNTIKWINLH